MAVTRKNAGNSSAEDRFIELFCDTFGAEKGQCSDMDNRSPKGIWEKMLISVKNGLSKMLISMK